MRCVVKKEGVNYCYLKGDLWWPVWWPCFCTAICNIKAFQTPLTNSFIKPSIKLIDQVLFFKRSKDGSTAGCFYCFIVHLKRVNTYDEKSSLTFNGYGYVACTYSLEPVLKRDRKGSGAMLFLIAILGNFLSHLFFRPPKWKQVIQFCFEFSLLSFVAKQGSSQHVGRSVLEDVSNRSLIWFVEQSPINLFLFRSRTNPLINDLD